MKSVAGDLRHRRRDLLRGTKAFKRSHPDGGVRGNLLKSRTPYLEFFGLNEAPFPATADPGRIFPALSYDRGHAALVRGITERQGLLCLVGEAGTGKTLLLRQLLGAPPPGVRPVLLLQPSIEFDALVERIAVQLGMAPSAGLAGLQTALAAEAQAGRNVLLLVEEAQALPPDTLAALPELTLPLTGSGGSAMQVLLAGRPVLLAALEAAGLRDRVAVLAYLEPWSPSDVAVYIHGQLARAGAAWRLFTPGAVARVARVTEGVPRRVSTIADASLVVASSVGAQSVNEEHVNAAWESHSELGAIRATFPRRTRRTRARLLPAGALAMVLVLGIVVARPPSWWHRGAGTTPERRRVAAAPPREPLPTASEALDAVDAFRRAYEAKDTAAVEDLLALDATEGGAARLAAVAPDVQALDQLEEVAYLQPAAQVEPRGPAMEVRTSFQVRYRDRAGRAGELRGTAVWQVARRDGAPRIVGLARALAPGSVLPAELASAKR